MLQQGTTWLSSVILCKLIYLFVAITYKTNAAPERSGSSRCPQENVPVRLTLWPWKWTFK